MDEHSNNSTLTEHMVLTKTRANSLSDVKTLNMWGFNLRDISLFERMPNVEICSLPVNQICNLAPLANCRKMRELFLRQNDISDFHELTYLSGLRFLKNLSLSGNPIANSPNYRQTVLQMIPQLEKLDDIETNQIHQPPPPQPQVNVPTSRRRSSSSMEPQFTSSNTSFSQTQQHPNHQNYDINNNNNFHYQMHQPPYQTMRPSRYGYSNANNNANNYNNNNGGKSDERALTAVLALLPELSPESLAIVMQSIEELQNS